MAGTQANRQPRKGKPDRERDALAARYRAEGWSYDHIAAEMGYADSSGATRAVKRALASSHREPMAEARHLELNSLDEMAREAWGVLRRPHLVVSQGKVALHPLTDEPLADDAPVLAAIGRLLDIQTRRAKLLGLDAASRIEVVTESAVDSAIRELERELGERAAGGSTASETDSPS